MRAAPKSRSPKPWLTAPSAEELADIDLIYSDGEPLESDWHVKAMGLLTASVHQHFHDRDDFYVAGNMFIYFSAEQARNTDFRGPDFFFVWNTSRRPMRKSWIVWEEDFRTPNVVIELCSATTRREDHGVKKDIYEQTLRVNDYFCYDPDKELLEGWRLKRGKYVPLNPNAEGRLWSAELGLWVGRWHGEWGTYEETWPRFFDQEGRLVLNPDEASKQLAEAATKRAEKERALVENERALVEKERALAEKERERADKADELANKERELAEKERERADKADQHALIAAARAAAAEAEVAALRERLASQEGKSNGANDQGKRKKSDWFDL